MDFKIGDVVLVSTTTLERVGESPLCGRVVADPSWDYGDGIYEYEVDTGTHWRFFRTNMMELLDRPV